MGLFAFRRDYVKNAEARLKVLVKGKVAGKRNEPGFDAAPYQVVEDTKQPTPAPASTKPRRKPRVKSNPDQVVLTPDTTQKGA